MSAVLFGVDLENGFCPGGELPVIDGDAVVPKFNTMKKSWDKGRQAGRNDIVMASLDFHPKDTDHFKKWPKHCVFGTKSAAFHPDVDTDGVVIVLKGLGAKEDAYSAFDGFVLVTAQSLEDYLKEHEVTEIYICGLATDYCILHTVLSACALRPKIRVIVVIDAIRAVNINPEDEASALEQMRQVGAEFMTTEKVVERMASRD